MTAATAEPINWRGHRCSRSRLGQVITRKGPMTRVHCATRQARSELFLPVNDSCTKPTGRSQASDTSHPTHLCEPRNNFTRSSYEEEVELKPQFGLIPLVTVKTCRLEFDLVRHNLHKPHAAMRKVGSVGIRRCSSLMHAPIPSDERRAFIN
jgi:hypothetical protein